MIKILLKKWDRQNQVSKACAATMLFVHKRLMLKILRRSSLLDKLNSLMASKKITRIMLKEADSTRTSILMSVVRPTFRLMKKVWMRTDLPRQTMATMTSRRSMFSGQVRGPNLLKPSAKVVDKIRVQTRMPFSAEDRHIMARRRALTSRAKVKKMDKSAQIIYWLAASKTINGSHIGPSWRERCRQLQCSRWPFRAQQL